MDEKPVNSVLPEVSRRRVLAVGALGVASLVFPVAGGRAADTSAPMFVYVGSYTKNPPGGGSNNPSRPAHPAQMNPLGQRNSANAAMHAASSR